MRWLDVPNFPGYQVSSTGIVRSRKICGRAFRLSNHWRILKQCRLRSGYMTVTLSRNGRLHPIPVHRLVLLTFRGKPKHGQQCRHRNGVRHDNCLRNLLWGTPLENHADKIRHGTTAKGVKHANAKFTEAHIREIRRLKQAGKHDDIIAAIFGTTGRYVRRICARERWAHIH